ncbi:SDR family oxidoreductase [Roseateles cellulosilyticus]|uniref:SDR family oxidoreductase n=1 Tax=Pelomonas cellulosilytica TaxID=2906762 RepID=A0ABS8Y368_9BURK|nr:SDR family oxidoreductase [Pelomonas sp. P8]MCE4557596.1 SDR family oxidoreductase [Pelomonas sp. P8]
MNMTTTRMLAGKKALITGGNSGIGLATAKLFLEHGAAVMITGRDEATLAAARASLGHDVLAERSDAGRLEDIDRLMVQAKARFEHLDVLVLNATGGSPVPIEFMTEAQFDAMNDVAFKGVFFAIQRALPLLRPGASIVVTTSLANQVGAPGFSAYGACKAAARSLVRTASLELAPRGIRVNAVCPGPVDTPGFGRWDVPREVVDAARADLTRRSPLQRFGTAEEIANAVLYLASPASSYVVGAELVVDGGFSQLM